jgi:hypothetical protein
MTYPPEYMASPFTQGSPFHKVIVAELRGGLERREV